MEDVSYSYKNYTMRPIEAEDLKMILEWRNSPRIHSVMLTEHKITWDEHKNWFEGMKSNPIKRNFVFEYKGTPVGYIGYTDFNPQDGICSPGLYIGEQKNLPPEAGIIIYYMSVVYAFEKFNMKRLDNFVLAKNEISMEISKFLGFKEYSEDNYSIQKDGQEEQVIHLALFREEWYKAQRGNHV